MFHWRLFNCHSLIWLFHFHRSLKIDIPIKSRTFDHQTLGKNPSVIVKTQIQEICVRKLVRNLMRRATNQKCLSFWLDFRVWKLEECLLSKKGRKYLGEVWSRAGKVLNVERIYCKSWKVVEIEINGTIIKARWKYWNWVYFASRSLYFKLDASWSVGSCFKNRIESAGF